MMITGLQRTAFVPHGQAAHSLQLPGAIVCTEAGTGGAERSYRQTPVASGEITVIIGFGLYTAVAALPAGSAGRGDSAFRCAPEEEQPNA